MNGTRTRRTEVRNTTQCVRSIPVRRKCSGSDASWLCRFFVSCMDNPFFFHPRWCGRSSHSLSAHAPGATGDTDFSKRELMYEFARMICFKTMIPMFATGDSQILSAAEWQKFKMLWENKQFLRISSTCEKIVNSTLKNRVICLKSLRTFQFAINSAVMSDLLCCYLQRNNA